MKRKKQKEIKEYAVLGLLVVLLVFGFYQTGQINELKEDVQNGEVTPPARTGGSSTSTPRAAAPQAQMVGGC